MAERYSSFESGSFNWLAQRVTAVFLVVTLAFHFFLLHFINHAADVTANQTATRMASVAYFATMVLFLITAAFHGVNGVYAALINQGLKGTQKTVVKWVLIVAGAALVGQGTYLALTMGGYL